MRNQPIQAEKNLCPYCTNAETKLTSFCRNAFGDVVLRIKNSGEGVNTVSLQKNNVEYFTLTSVKALNKFFEIHKSEWAELFINSPLHDETYEYSHADGEWYLVKQGEGFA